MIKIQTENKFWNKGIKVGKTINKKNYKRTLPIPIHSLTKEQKQQQTNNTEKTTKITRKVKDLVNKIESKTKI